jgi:hypothetical protein
MSTGDKVEAELLWRGDAGTPSSHRVAWWVLYAHAPTVAPRLALGGLAPLGRLLGDPQRGWVGVFLDLRNVFPGEPAPSRA